MGLSPDTEYGILRQTHKGIISKNIYLLLGDQVNGTTDSTVFGLVDKSDILGKAIVIK
ncbi:MAG: S26 family signal peptidase [Patescibacteria group bacterium]